MALFIVSGIQIHLVNNAAALSTIVPFLTHSDVRLLHILLGIFIGLWDTIYYLGYLSVSGHITDIIPTPHEILDLIAIVLCTLRIWPDSKYPHYGWYDPVKKAHVRKYHPGQKMVALGDLGAMVLIGITGIGLAEAQIPGSMGILGILAPLNDVFILPAALLTLSVPQVIRIFHFCLFVYFAATTLLHVYLALIPQNLSKMRGMWLGSERIPHSESEFHEE